MVEFFVAGRPKPAGSKRAFVIPEKGDRKARAVLVDDSGSKGKNWRGDVRSAAEEAMREAGLRPFSGAVEVDLRFYMRRPRGHYGSGRNADVLKPAAPRWCSSQPDVDKLSRAILDALKGVVWVDDALVAKKQAAKPYANRHLGEREGLSVRVKSLDDAMAEGLRGSAAAAAVRHTLADDGSLQLRLG